MNLSDINIGEDRFLTSRKCSVFVHVFTKEPPRISAYLLLEGHFQRDNHGVRVRTDFIVLEMTRSAVYYLRRFFKFHSKHFGILACVVRF